MKLEVEMSDHADDRRNRGYGRVHKAGCRDLIDPEPIGETDSRSAIAGLVEQAVGWEAEDGQEYDRIAPCVTLKS